MNSQYPHAPVDEVALPDRLPRASICLGYAGLLPQVVALGLVAAGGPGWRFTALGIAFAYSALIFSFLGGVWWGLAAAAGSRTPRWVWAVAVLPSLAALISAWPWMTGGTWPGPSLVGLGLAIMSSIGVDVALRRRGLTPGGWLALRIPLSLCLGLLTIAIGVLALATDPT